MNEPIPTTIVPEWRLIRRKRDGQPAHVLLTADGHFIWCPGKSWALPAGWEWGGTPAPEAEYSKRRDLLIAEAMPAHLPGDPLGCGPVPTIENEAAGRGDA